MAGLLVFPFHPNTEPIHSTQDDDPREDKDWIQYPSPCRTYPLPRKEEAYWGTNSWFCPYKRPVSRQRRGGEKEERPRKREQNTGEQKTKKKPKKRRTHNKKKKNTRAKERRTFSRQDHHFHLHLRLRLRHRQVRPSFSLFFCISCCKRRKQGEGNLNHACLLPSQVTGLGQWPGWAGRV